MHSLTTQAIILAGGLGTRLREAVPDLPKCMAPVAGRSFVAHVIDTLRRQGIQRFIFSLGYKAEAIQQYLQEEYPTLQYACVIEEEPLGTGGAIALCMHEATEENALIANGDTLFNIDLNMLSDVHLQYNAECSLALKPMEDFDRYGVVTIDESNCVTGFMEKKWQALGSINGGIYLLNKQKFSQRSFPQKFSFEKDYLEKVVNEKVFYGSIQNGYFIDIGIPEDYNKAQADLQSRTLDLSSIDKTWTLFLDRDGVVNKERKGDYVKTPDELIFEEGALEAISLLHKRFGLLLIISNQRGVGRELMSLNDLHKVHDHLRKEVSNSGGQINGIYFCTDTDDKCFLRKPNPGMALQAKKDFPNIDFSKTIMVGNKPGDMRFGRAAGAFTVFITSTNPHQPFPHPDIDLLFPDLLSFAKALQP